MPASSAHTQDATRAHRKGKRTAERILDAAEALFAERGYVGTSLRDVAAEVGIRIPSLYNHFENKDGLYAAVLERDLQPVFMALSEYVGPDGPEGQHPRHLVETVMRVMAEHPRVASLIQHETLTGGEHLTPMLRGWMAPIFDRAIEMVDPGLAGERWDRDELSLLVLAMYHIIIGHFTIAPLWQSLNGGDLLSEEMLAKQTRIFTELVEMVFAPPGRS